MLTEYLIRSLLQIIIKILLYALNLFCLFKLEPQHLSLDLTVQVNVDAKVLLYPLVYYFEGEAEGQDDEQRDDGSKD